MNSTDPFTTAARAEVESLVGPYSILKDQSKAYHEGFTAGAEWARSHLAAQEPTGEGLSSPVAAAHNRAVSRSIGARGLFQ